MINQRLAQLGELAGGALHRLDEQKRISKQTGKRFFTSDLSVNEHLLTREAGYEPIGMVMGTSFYQVGFFGYFRGYRTKTGEVDTLTQAQLAVRELAMSRMQQEAKILDADGIIGVRLQQRKKGWGIGMIEFTAIGTAIKIFNRHPTSVPFTSDLSGQEFWQLLQAGYYPKGLVFGACSYYVHSNRNTRNLMNPTIWMRLFGQARFNQELVQYTQGFQDARELAITRLTEDIKKVGATGAVGIHIEKTEEVIVYRRGFPWGWLITPCIFLMFFAVNTGNVVLTHFLIFAIPFLLITSIIFNIIQSIVNPANTGIFRDILTNFVIIGTAIVENEVPPENTINKPLMFIPLNKI